MAQAPRYRFALMSLMWGYELAADAVDPWLDAAAAAGYQGIATFEQVLERFEDLPRRWRERGLELASVDAQVTDDMGRVDRLCARLAELGCRHLVLIGGLATRDADPGLIADLLNRSGAIARRHGVAACYHNHTGNTGETLEGFEDLMARTDPDLVAAFLDVGHATKDFHGHDHGRRAALFLERNRDRLGFIEFKDWSDEHRLCTEVGSGLCDYRAVFRLLDEIGYRGWITVEQNGPMGDKPPADSARDSLAFIRRSLQGAEVGHA